MGIYQVEYYLVGTVNCIRWNFLDWNNLDENFLGGNYPGGIFLGGNCPGGSYPGWEFSGWELCSWELSWVEILWMGVILGGNFPRCEFSGWYLSGGNHPGGNFLGGSFPSTLRAPMYFLKSNSCQPWSFICKCSILDVTQGSEYVSALHLSKDQIFSVALKRSIEKKLNSDIIFSQA